MIDLFDGATDAENFALQTSRTAVKINPRPLARLLSENCFHRALPFHFTRLAVAALVWPDQGSLHSSIMISGSTTISDFTELATRLYFCAAWSARRVRASIVARGSPAAAIRITGRKCSRGHIR